MGVELVEVEGRRNCDWDVFYKRRKMKSVGTLLSINKIMQMEF